MKCLGNEISYDILRPDPARLSAVKGSKIPKDKLTPNFSAKVAQLTGAYVEFPLNKVVQKAINILKE
ncbi:hypothetical protein GJ496_006129 [Pomphorhynchus laevis]|nr:hypothetical protein GJ496_006129 [Pomphorhynchus laevis]